LEERTFGTSWKNWHPWSPRDVNGIRMRGEMLRKHDAAEAGVLLERGLESLGLTLGEARKLRQNDPRKQALIWLVKSRTVVPDQWIQEKLRVENRSNVSRAVSACRVETSRDVRRWKRLLHKSTA